MRKWTMTYQGEETEVVAVSDIIQFLENAHMYDRDKITHCIGLLKKK